MNRILVIGASGFIGRQLMKTLPQISAAEVLGTSSRDACPELVKFELESDSISQRLPHSWRDPAERSWAILCASVSPVDRCATEAAHAQSVMIDGSMRCVNELADLGYRVVFLSTSYVFGDAARGFREEDRTGPMNQYGQLKRDMEMFLEQEHPSSLVARLGKVVSSSPDDQHLFSEWQRLAERGEPIVCIEHQVLVPTLVDDVVNMLQQACRHELRGCYHIANPEPVTRYDLANRFLSVCQLKTEIRATSVAELQLAEPRPLSSWLNSDKITRELNTRFTSISQMLEQYRDNMQRQG